MDRKELQTQLDLADFDPTRKPDPNPPENLGSWTRFFNWHLKVPEPEKLGKKRVGSGRVRVNLAS